MTPLLLAVMGPTASGKTRLAEGLADRLDAQLVNFDASQMFRGLDVGTAKPEHRDRYLFIDHLAPEEEMGVGRYVLEAAEALAELFDAGRNVVMVGGTGLYIRALLGGYTDLAPAPDPALRARLGAELAVYGLEEMVRRLADLGQTLSSEEMKNPTRVLRALERAFQPERLSFRLPPFDIRKLVLEPGREGLVARIHQRTLSMLHNGWVREVESLRSGGLTRDAAAMRAIGYRTVWDHLNGSVSTTDLEAMIVRDTVAYAKRQTTWFRKEQGAHRFAGFGEEGLEEALLLVRR